MFKKVAAFIMAAVLAVSMFPVLRVNADSSEEAVAVSYYVKQYSAGGSGTKSNPFGSIEQAINELPEKGGTIYIMDTYNIINEYWHAENKELTI